VDFLDGNRLTLLRSGTEYFPALAAAIGGARSEVYLETYIFADDPAGRMIEAALVAAAARGVRVHLVVDGFGARRFFGEVRARLEASAVQILVYRAEMASVARGRARLRRLHRKLAVVDGRIAFVGGINIIDDMNTPGHTPPRIDFAVAVEGPLAAVVRHRAEELWRLVAWSSFERPAPAVPPPAVPAAAGFQRAALVVRDNFRHRSDIEDAYLGAIEHANEEVVIACAYFFPGRAFRRALVEAVARGVTVKLILQRRVEYVLLHYASRALYGYLLDSGVHIHEYSRSFLHAKVAVVDGRWATVGSSNIDPFSLLLAREANLVAEDRRFAQELRDALHAIIEKETLPVERLRWRKKPLGLRVRIWVAYGIARLLIGVFGYGGRQY
jgi:cardiolipin synthase